MGGPVWACLGGSVLWACFPVSKPLQSNGKQTTPTTGKTLAGYFLLFYCDMKNKRQKQKTEHQKSKNKFAYIIRYRKFLQKISKKICKVIFLS